MIIYAITNALYTLFGDSVEIYTDVTVQGNKAPCFFVREINVNAKDYIDGRKGITHTFDIAYLSDEDRMDGRGLNLIEVSNTLVNEFEFLEYEGELYRAYDRKTEKVDNDLHFTFSVFETFREDKSNIPLMEKLEMKWK